MGERRPHPRKAQVLEVLMRAKASVYDVARRTPPSPADAPHEGATRRPGSLVEVEVPPTFGTSHEVDITLTL
ncbi:hypothetical protein GCM10025868_06620 [Angustibacter aerolatus]|uniref:Uncharacterized protein n=1 Tax=Angustibacter aerolatus TaxID=1162965 RepID=A0ABQ6JET2_9ACTN|nr:hypothetical protein GCM10025868_06620 [Angustibacter aerolatus]